MAKVLYDPPRLESEVVAELMELARRVNEIRDQLTSEGISGLMLDNEGFKKRGFRDITMWINKANGVLATAIEAKKQADRESARKSPPSKGREPPKRK